MRPGVLYGVCLALTALAGGCGFGRARTPWDDLKALQTEIGRASCRERVY